MIRFDKNNIGKKSKNDCNPKYLTMWGVGPRVGRALALRFQPSFIPGACSISCSSLVHQSKGSGSNDDTFGTLSEHKFDGFNLDLADEGVRKSRFVEENDAEEQFLDTIADTMRWDAFSPECLTL